MGDKFIVVGSNSFTGSHFVRRLLRKGHDVLAISRSDQLDKVYLAYSDISDKKKFKFEKININTDTKRLRMSISSFQPNYIVNFAAQSMVGQSWESPLDWFNTNVLGTIGLIDIAKDLSSLSLFVQISTPEVYGSVMYPVKEDQIFSPSTPYAVSRASSDMYLHALGKATNFPFLITRSSNVYGPGQRLYRLIPKLITKIRKGEKFQLEGDGSSLRSFLYIDDVISGIIKAINLGSPGHTFHFSTNEQVSIVSIVKKICHYMGVDFEKNVEYVPDRVGKDMVYDLDSYKSNTLLDWKPQISLTQGIKKTVSWIENNYETLSNHSDTYIHKR